MTHIIFHSKNNDTMDSDFNLIDLRSSWLFWKYGYDLKFASVMYGTYNGLLH